MEKFGLGSFLKSFLWPNVPEKVMNIYLFWLNCGVIFKSYHWIHFILVYLINNWNALGW